MSKPIRPLLPPLHDGHRVPPIPSAGVWHPLGSADPLRVIAKGLATRQRTDATVDIVSVPDIWAQLTVFHNALIEEAHPLHGRVVAEWRGLLTCFALAPYRVHGLTCEAFRLSELAESRWTAIVRRLVPSAPLLDGAAIDEVAVVRIDRIPVALVQPLTLVAPSRSLIDLGGRPLVPWMAEGRFVDPLPVAGLGRDERWALSRFLQRLELALAPHRAEPDFSAMIGHVRAFQADAAPSGPSPTFTDQPSRLRLPALPVFAPFTRWEQAALPPGEVSDCLLRLRTGLDTPLKGVVLFDPELDRMLGRPANDLRVWKSNSLRMLQDRPELLGDIRTDAQNAGYLVVELRELFLPVLYRAEGVGGERGFDQHPVGARERLLPLSPLVLAFLDGPALSAACKVSVGGDGVAVHLALPLASGASLSIARVYAREEAMEPPLTLSSWPDFQAPWWRMHLALTGASTDIQFSPSGLVSLEGMRRLFAGNDGYSAVAAARAVLGGTVAEIGDVTWLRDDRRVAQALHGLPGMAEAAVLEDRSGANRRLAGLLLLPLPKPATDGAGDTPAVVGIDFGTTNTAAYLRVGGGAPAPLLLPARQITAYSVTEQGRDLLDREFLPASAVDIPFQTILSVRQRQGGDGDLRIFRDALIYFAQQRKSALEQFQGNAAGLYFNLKWADEQDGRKRVELFLTEVAILALAELGARGIPPARVSFRFSFPEAFRPWQVTGFQAAARNATRIALEAVSGEPCAAPPIGFQTESVASASYFIHAMGAPATEGLITLDIGGQTTDIAVVQTQRVGTQRLAWRGSFELGGRHLLIEHLREHPGLLRSLARHRPDLKLLVDTLAERRTTDDGRRTLATELVVNSAAFAKAIDRDLATMANLPEAERLRAVALTGLAGLLDYTGRVVRALVEAGSVEPRPNTAISVCLGGRASLLYRALLHSDDERSALLRFFTDATGHAMRRAELVFSDRPKEEVAYGLVRDDGGLAPGQYVPPPLGETVRSGERELPATAEVTALDMAAPCRIEAAPEFARFVARLPEIGINPILTDAIMGSLTGEANQEIMQAQTRAQSKSGDGAVDDSSSMEPPFVVLLRQFVHRLAVDAKPLRL
jgi:hypothetical protein